MTAFWILIVAYLLLGVLTVICCYPDLTPNNAWHWAIVVVAWPAMWVAICGTRRY